MFEDVLETLLRRVTETYGQTSEEARKQWFRRAGEPFLDERDYEQRMQNFVEWYVFDFRLSTGLSPFEAFLTDPGQSAEEKEAFQPFRDQVHSLFQLGNRLFGGGMYARDLHDGKKYPLGLESTTGYTPGVVMEMRLVPVEDGFRPTQTSLYYESSMARLVKRAARVVRKKGGDEAWEALLFRASYLHLKASRFRHVETKEIFKDLVHTDRLGASA